MEQAINLFTKLVLQHPGADLHAILNGVLATLDKDELKDVEEYFMIIFLMGEKVRKAPAEIAAVLKAETNYEIQRKNDLRPVGHYGRAS